MGGIKDQEEEEVGSPKGMAKRGGTMVVGEQIPKVTTAGTLPLEGS